MTTAARDHLNRVEALEQHRDDSNPARQFLQAGYAACPGRDHRQGRHLPGLPALVHHQQLLPPVDQQGIRPEVVRLFPGVKDGKTVVNLRSTPPEARRRHAYVGIAAKPEEEPAQPPDVPF